jgi:hypothetical protein
MSDVAWVGENNYGRFSAHVEYDEPGPFGFMIGPHDATAGEAVAWARHRAPRVYMRLGDQHFSAGDEPIDGLAPWRPPAEAQPEVAATESSGPRRFTVAAGTVWFRPDRSEVARRLAEAVNRDPRAAGAVAATTKHGFEVIFTVLASSRVDANETASFVVRRAWAGLNIDATPGDDYDLSSIQATPACAPAPDTPT